MPTRDYLQGYADGMTRVVTLIVKALEEASQDDEDENPPNLADFSTGLRHF